MKNTKTHFLTNYAKPDTIRPLSASSARKEEELLEYIISFVLSVMASVVGDYVCKWLDRHKSDK